MTLKIKQEHYNHIAEAMQLTVSKLGSSHIVAYMDKLAQDSKIKDVDKRFRWDLLYASGLSQFICDNIYKYMDDNHLDSALKSIVNNLDYK